MRYTIAALGINDRDIEVMRSSLLAVGASRDAIVIQAGLAGISQPHISVSTSNLEESESFREALELSVGALVISHEESSTYDAVR